MRTIPRPMRDEMALDPAMRTCMRAEIFHDHECAPNPMTGRMHEWEHAFIHGGKQINERWAIISSCYWAHSGPGLDKDKNRYIALARATPEDLAKYPKTNWYTLFAYLTAKFYFDAHIDPLHGPHHFHTDCWMCAVVDEIL